MKQTHLIPIVTQKNPFKTLIFFFLSSIFDFSSAVVHFKGESFSFTFIDAPARFGVPVNRSGICGALYVADPLDACSPLRNPVFGVTDPVRFVLIERGGCNFEDKVQNAQDGGFAAAIVYSDRRNSNLISMIGNSEGIWAHAVFVSKEAGETLKRFAAGEEGECCIYPSSEEAAWTVLVISFISLLVIVSVLALFFFTRNRRIHWQATHHCPLSVDSEIVEVLPSFVFSTVHPNGKGTAETCAICLEDYRDGETLRVLPCQHEFHTVCIDLWLTKWGTFCPVCKHDVSMGLACERTPLLPSF